MSLPIPKIAAALSIALLVAGPRSRARGLAQGLTFGPSHRFIAGLSSHALAIAGRSMQGTKIDLLDIVYFLS
jgi:hypothetical protein